MPYALGKPENAVLHKKLFNNDWRKYEPNRELLIFVASQLQELLEPLVFVGGCTTEIFMTDGIRRSPRPTKDVDAIVQVSSRVEYQKLSQALRNKGFTEDATMGAPMCRWCFQDATLDVMPTDEAILGFTNRWYVPALQTSQPYQLTETLKIKLIQAPYFIATKLEAFFTRGDNDYVMSHDLEDIIMVFDGRIELLHEIRESSLELRQDLAASFQKLLSNPDFIDAIATHLAPDQASQARQHILLEQFHKVAAF
jgi:predicted nucleotidyltransferase